MKRMIRVFVTASLVAVLMPSIPVQAESAEVINAKVTDTISTFKEDVNGADVILAQASGYLVFPRVIKIGIGIGGETGEGVLRIGGRNVAYYRTMAGSFGLQLGAQAKSIIIAFMTPESLEKFRNSSGWKVGVDGSVALGFPGIGLSKSIDSHNIKDPVVGFVFGSKGLMYNLTLEGTKITKIEK
jgi:lipid-binding SYLF domain-containing protein